MSYPLYSAALWSFETFDSSGSPYISDAVASGLVSVLRDISILAYAADGLEFKLSLVDTAGDVFGFFGADVASGSASVYPIHEECRVVLATGWAFRFDVYSGSFTGVLSGYNLSSP